MYRSLEEIEVRKFKERFIVVPIAPATIIPRKMCFDSVNYASTRDFVPLIKFSLGSGMRGAQEFEYLPNEPQVAKPAHIEELKFLTPHKDAKFFDHSFDSPTFTETINKVLKSYIKDFGI